MKNKEEEEGKREKKTDDFTANVLGIGAPVQITVF